MTRKIPLTVFAAAQCLIAGLAATLPAQAAPAIPQYFFSQWTVTSNCTGANAGPAVQVQAGLQFKIANAPAANGTYTLQTINSAGKQWASAWNGLQLHYRAGTQLTSIPADFECVAGAEASSASASPLLAMSGYVQAVEPQYEQQHWYGLAKIKGQVEHVLIFPLDTRTGGTSAIVVLSSSTTESAVADSSTTIAEVPPVRVARGKISTCSTCPLIFASPYQCCCSYCGSTA